MRQIPRFLTRSSLVMYVIVTVPFMTVFIKNDYARFVYMETVSHWYSRIRPPSYVFIGDSITAGGRNWGWRLHGNPLASRNLAGNGYTTAQIASQVKIALAYSPDYVLVMAGTNDILNGAPPEVAVREYRKLLQSFAGTAAQPIITLMPHQASSAYQETTEEFNRAIRDLATGMEVEWLDLNPKIAPSGQLLPQYSTDGVHFSDAAYRVWCEEILRVLNRPD